MPKRIKKIHTFDGDSCSPRMLLLGVVWALFTLDFNKGKKALPFLTSKHHTHTNAHSSLPVGELLLKLLILQILQLLNKNILAAGKECAGCTVYLSPRFILFVLAVDL